MAADSSFQSLVEAENYILSRPDCNALLIAGPTASGKSAFAVRLAERIGGVVINTDSMQVYRDLFILSARPTPEETLGIPHLLFGHVDGAENYNAGRYLKDVEDILASAEVKGKIPIFTGGTGFYFKVLLEGLSPVPDVPEPVRDSLRAWARERDTSALYRRLYDVDPGYAERLGGSDRLRILRALEVYEATGKSLLDFHGERTPGPLAGGATLRFFLEPERAELNRRIDLRFLGMMKRGALEEAAGLFKRQLDPLLPVMRACGVRPLVEHLNGSLGLEEAVIQAQTDSRRYAKRQMTWARHQMSDWRWVRL
ncbi:MAG: tRNA (adenosine(37)-N6)-dimethylallyltransferase MiaA [Methylobacteriaceae bacterium]|jgi:tRNA dimethylallyltransferase|nr:tRNA (adenosine(37)-N6)-dimethylallyltransferase MiaA [Methylobacteriaceae bacterium]